MNCILYIMNASSAIPPADQPIVFEYFLKAVNTPGWHWLFRIIFGLGLFIAAVVYFRYRESESKDGDDRA